MKYLKYLMILFLYLIHGQKKITRKNQLIIQNLIKHYFKYKITKK